MIMMEKKGVSIWEKKGVEFIFWIYSRYLEFEEILFFFDLYIIIIILSEE